MKTSRTKFIIVFVLAALAFQFISNSLLGTEIQLFPPAGEWYPGLGSQIPWKHTIGTFIHPIKYILIEPLSFLNQDPDAPPPVLLIAFGLYWAAIAFVLHVLIRTVIRSKVAPR